MTINPKTLKRGVREDIIQNKGWEDKSTEEQDALLSELSVSEAFEAYCTWHGLLGWSSTLMSTMANIQEAAR